jgi:hypothetical protein
MRWISLFPFIFLIIGKKYDGFYSILKDKFKKVKKDMNFRFMVSGSRLAVNNRDKIKKLKNCFAK